MAATLLLAHIEAKSKKIAVPNDTDVSIAVVRSLYHMKLSPSDMGGFKDLHVSQTLIREYAQLPPIMGWKGWLACGAEH